MNALEFLAALTQLIFLAIFAVTVLPITVASTEGEGSTCTVTLPLNAAPA